MNRYMNSYFIFILTWSTTN